MKKIISKKSKKIVRKTINPKKKKTVVPKRKSSAKKAVKHFTLDAKKFSSIFDFIKKYEKEAKNIQNQAKKTIKKSVKKADQSFEKIYKQHEFLEKNRRAVGFALFGILIIVIAGVVLVKETEASEKGVLQESITVQKNVKGNTSVITKESFSAPLLDGVDLEKLNFQGKVPILMYHYVGPIETGFDETRRGLTVTPENFRFQMKWLKDNGFQTLTMSQYFQRIALGQSLPVKPVIITFDDGYQDVYDNAIPVMQEYGQVATLFIIANAVGPVYMNWDEIKKADKMGFEIGSHTLSHPRLTDFSDSGLKKEIEGSRVTLENALGKKVNFFCYPYGIFNQRVMDVVKSSGYKGAITTGSGNIVTSSNIFEMPRIRISGGMSEDGFIWTMNNALQ